MKIVIPENITLVLNLLNRCGFEAYAVGGCVRDSLLGRHPNDWDVCTSALPAQTMECFEKYRQIPTGIKHGTVTVIVGSPVEITTFRVDGDYADNRHPESVEFTSNLAEDLKRRDFTVNAMAAGINGEVIDLFGGREDLKKRIIRCVGNPSERFDEDALRIMRALRFAATLGFETEEKTSAAIHAKKELLRNIAAERIHAETDKLLNGNCGKILADFADVFTVSLPEAALPEAAEQIGASQGGLPVKLALMLQKLNADEAEKALRRLKYDKVTVRTVSTIIKHKNDKISAEKPPIKRLLNSAGEKSTGLIVDFLFSYGKLTGNERGKIIETFNEIIALGECFTLSALAVNGSDISALKICPENKVGAVLYALLSAVIDGKVRNEKSELIAYAEEGVEH